MGVVMHSMEMCSGPPTVPLSRMLAASRPDEGV